MNISENARMEIISFESIDDFLIESSIYLGRIVLEPVFDFWTDIWVEKGIETTEQNPTYEESIIELDSLFFFEERAQSETNMYNKCKMIERCIRLESRKGVPSSDRYSWEYVRDERIHIQKSSL
mgnify:FL=1